MTLVRDGQPAATIVVSERPTPAARLAAVELQHHVERITGATLPVVSDGEETDGVRILVGESRQTLAMGIKADEFEPQEYMIRFDPDVVVLIGRDWQDTPQNRGEPGRDTYGQSLASTRNVIDYNQATGRADLGNKPLELPGLFDDQGTCYATYHFLEAFCGVRWYGPSEINIVYPRKQTLAVRGSTIRRSRSLKHFHGTGGMFPIINVQWNRPGGDQLNLYWRRLRIGGEKWSGNHTIMRTSIAQTFNDPEYQAVGRGKGTQLCYSNPKLVQAVAQAARDYFDGKQLRDTSRAMGDYFAVVPDDNDFWCECEQCRKALAISRQDTRGEGFFSNARSSYYIFDFVNHVAAEVGKTHPEKYIAALAYASYAYPPKGLKLEPNISVAPCLHLCYAFDGRTYYQNDLAIYNGWLRQGDRPLYLWNYFHHPLEPAVMNGWNCFPLFMPNAIAAEVKRYHRDGIRGVFLCGIGQQVDFYLYAQLAFNVDADARALVDEFFGLYFGRAAGPMKAFYYDIRNINREERVLGTSRENSWAKLGTPQRMKKLEKLIERAASLAETDPQKKRVETWRVGVWEYMKKGYDAFYAGEQAGSRQGDGP